MKNDNPYESPKASCLPITKQKRWSLTEILLFVGGMLSTIGLMLAIIANYEVYRRTRGFEIVISETDSHFLISLSKIGMGMFICGVIPSSLLLGLRRKRKRLKEE